MRYTTMKKTPMIMMSIFALLLTGTHLISCHRDNSKDTESISFGAITSGSVALVYIAQDQGFFQAEGLKVQVKDYPTGVATTDALLAGEVDIAWSAEFPMVARALKGEAISIFAVSNRFSDQFLFGLRESGIAHISDLKGKTIGLPLKTIAEFYLGRFFLLNGMRLNDVSLVNVLPAQSMEALAKGNVDGVVTWEPYTNRIKDQLADRIIAWPVQSSQPGFGIMIGRNTWLREKPGIVTGFLNALLKAEEFQTHNTKKAKEIVQKKVNYDNAFMDIFWSETPFSISLDQALIIAMEDEARWMIANDLTSKGQVPNFLDYIYEDALKSLKPEAVNLIR